MKVLVIAFLCGTSSMKRTRNSPLYTRKSNMTLRALPPLLSALVFLPLLTAQTAITITGPLTLGPQPGSQFNFTGGGAVTVTPGGAAQMKLDVTGTGDDQCNDNILSDAVVTMANGDKLNLTLFAPGTSGATFPGTFVVTGGTGQFAGKGGSGTATFALSTPPPNIALTLSLAGNLTNQLTVTPAITPTGVVPVGHTRNTIQPGSWISVYGRNLANGTTIWDGSTSNIPTTLGGVTATINGKAAYFWFTSPGQLNLQAPDDTKYGCVNVTVNTPNGTVSTQVNNNFAAPSLNLLDAKYPAAIVLTPDGSGTAPGGQYSIVGPTGRFSYPTRPIKRGENLVLYGVGFGPTNPAVAAGNTFRGSAPTPKDFQLQVLLGNNLIPIAYSGLVGTGLYQINITVPANTPSGDVPLRIVTPGVSAQSQDGIFLTIQ